MNDPEPTWPVLTAPPDRRPEPPRATYGQACFEHAYAWAERACIRCGHIPTDNPDQEDQ